MKICLAIPGSFAFLYDTDDVKTNEQKYWNEEEVGIWAGQLLCDIVTETIQEGINDLWQHNQVSTSVISFFPIGLNETSTGHEVDLMWTQMLNRFGNPNEHGTHQQWKCFNLTEGNNKDNKW